MRKGELITTAQAAHILGLTVATVNKRAKAGLIPVAQQLPGETGARLFDSDEIERLAQQRLAAAAAS